MQIKIKTALAMRRLGGVIASSCVPGSVVYLQGELGAGKTTLVRGFLRRIGYKGHVRSPTFNLFETYQVKGQTICHFDLYRLIKPEELVYVGVVDYFNEENICLIEWPDHGKGFLPEADLFCSFDFVTKGQARVVEISATSSKGEMMVEKIVKNENLF
ncbi:MAG: tRNA (adenosine(37)-N6)-threonylcarbamoyltransferase complex ATPase subunit type 1 TsaE [Gammaproteobacteria bacterium]|nr:tRNA (adenosine(37)-N6)-threonylcarbamoyltransferase complex ATPase subunit type 1 TsaE [Gammaproteobacteria bacterium]